jgi:hypothetical protein
MDASLLWRIKILDQLSEVDLQNEGLQGRGAGNACGSSVKESSRLALLGRYFWVHEVGTEGRFFCFGVQYLPRKTGVKAGALFVESSNSGENFWGFGMVVLDEPAGFNECECLLVKPHGQIRKTGESLSIPQLEKASLLGSAPG